MRQRQWICGVINFLLFLIGAGLLAAGLVVMLNIFPDIVKKTVKKNKLLGLDDNGEFNDFTKAWANPSYVSMMQYWAFDYQNTIGIMNRALYPDMDEKGPYTYDEIISNTKINFTDDGEQMQFATSTQYVFNAKKSCATCNPKNDTVTVPDISFFVGMQKIDALVEKFLGSKGVIGICQLVLAEKCEELRKLAEREIGSFLTIFKTQPFVRVTVDQLLFSGYVSPLVTNLADRLIQISNKLLGTKYPPIDDKPFIVTLNNKNGTTDVLYTVLTGKKDYLETGYILSFTNISNTSLPSKDNNLPSDWWPRAGKDKCDSHALILEGTNGDFFKSFIEKNDSLPIYISDICRSVRLNFEKEVSVQGTPGYRFVLPPEEFDYSLPENCGFCNPNTLSRYGAYDRPVNSSCLPTGLLDISGCQKSPIIISKPHFYQASQIVQSFVPRFKPSYENDETTLDIEPTTGTVLSANKRIQINALVNQFSKIGAYSVIRPGAYPLVWLNESFSMDKKTRNDLHSSLIQPKRTIEIICWSSIGVGGLLMFLSVLLCIINVSCFGYRKAKKNN